MQYVSKPHYYIGNRRQENNGLGRIGVSGQIFRYWEGNCGPVQGGIVLTTVWWISENMIRLGRHTERGVTE